MANPKIQLRHDTSTNWQTQNPVLLEGEVAIETDSNKVKIGNGTDNYNTLPYITDQTKINLDYSNADYQPVNKAGDTMSGTLSIDTDGTNIELNSPNFTKGTNPSSTRYLSILMNDSSNSSSWQAKRLGMIEHQSLLDGTERIVIAPYRNVANSTDHAIFAISIPQSGNGYCSFPSTTCCDGQWVYLYQEAVGTSGYTLNKSTAHSWTFSNLPAQNCEVLFSYKSGGAVETAIFSSLINSSSMRATGTANQIAYGILPVGSNKQISIQNLSTNTSTSILTFRIFAYRKLGSNTQ